MKILNLFLLSSLISVSLFGAFILFNKDKTELQNTHTTINDWYTCWYGYTKMPTCDLDVKSDQENCNKADKDVYDCSDLEQNKTRVPSCTKFWQYVTEAKNYDQLLPESYYQCAEDCRQYAKQNQFYYDNIYTVYWDYCGNF